MSIRATGALNTGGPQTLRWVIGALVSHWRRNPTQAATLFVGLAVATALFAGVQAINLQARTSYDAAAAQLGGNQLASFTASEGAIDAAVFGALRRAGWPVSPVVEGRITIEGQRYAVFGVDLATLPRDATGTLFSGFNTRADGSETYQPADFLLPPYLSLAAPETVARLQTVADRPEALGRLIALEGVQPRTLFMDIGAAQQTLQLEGQISRLLIGPGDTQSLTPAEEIAAAANVELQRSAPPTTNDIARLTRSFHLNLTAFGFLSFFVGLLIVHAAIGLAFEQRRPMIRTIRACGVSARLLTAALVIELLVIACVAGLAGMALGYVIAAALLPDVALTLSSLYGATVPGALVIQPVWWLIGLAVATGGALFAAASSLRKAARMPILAPARPEAWRSAEQRSIAGNAVGALALIAFAVILTQTGGGLVGGFFLLGAVLVAAALLLPVALSFALQLGEKIARGPVTQWFWADGRQQLPAISLALQALLIALAVNIGVGAMVASFRDTFTGWLDQRLAAEIYVNAPPADAAAIEDYLWSEENVSAVLPATFAQTRYGDLPARIMGVTPHDTYAQNWPLISKTADAWESLARGDAVLINEQMARRFDLKPGDRIEVAADNGMIIREVGAVYSDYGNTMSEIMAPYDLVVSRWSDANVKLFLVRADPSAAADIIAALTDKFVLDENSIIDQQSLKVISKQIFERTFSVTAALNVLTLAVAGVALLTSLLSLAAARLPQVAPLWATGLTRAQLSGLDFLKTLAFALLTGLLAIPLGVIVAWLLTAVINVEAFGWRLPLFYYPGQWATLIVLALITAAAASTPSVLALRRIAPARLLKVFADGR